MLIMPATDVNFQALAENIAGDFFANGVPLADGIVKTAKEHGFTPEEVTRLVEKTNTAASIHLLKTADDKKSAFTLAQAALVLQRTHPAAQQEKTAASRVYMGIPVTRSGSAARSREKTAAVAAGSPPSGDIDAMQAVFTVRKALDEKKLQKVALELQVQDRIDYLASEFNTWNGPDFHKFAADCMGLFGRRCEPVLEGLAKYLRLPLSKTAGVAVVDDRSGHVTAMRGICDGLSSLLKLGSEIDELEGVLGGLWRGLKEATR
jgi:hypothetical protein